MAVQTQAQPFWQLVEKATSPERIRLTLFYFDTCQATLQRQATAFQQLDQVENLAQRRRDGTLRRYARMLRDTYPKNDPSLTNLQRAELFLNVAKKARANRDEQIASVCEHFAGQYFYLGEDYGKAFQYLLSANERFRQIGFANIPEIHRYLYELAFNYYYFNEDTKVIELLTEAARYEPFNANLHIQTYNTLALAYAQQRPQSAAITRLAEQNYQKAYQLARHYGDSTWMGITHGNLGGLYALQGRWQDALNAARVDYQWEIRLAPRNGYPVTAVLDMARAFYELGQPDSCRFYLDEARRIHRLNKKGDAYGQSLQDERFWHRYYETAHRYYKQIGNPAESARCADSLLVYQARIDKRYQSKAAVLAEQRLLIKQYETNAARLEERGQTQRVLLGAGGVVAVLVALILGWFYRSSQRQQENIANAEREQQLEHEKQLVGISPDSIRKTKYRIRKKLGINGATSLSELLD